MSTLAIIKDFQFTRDFKNINWQATIMYNLIRAFSAGFVIGVLMFLFPSSEVDKYTAIIIPLFWPIAYLTLFLPLGIIFSVLHRLPFVGLIAVFFSLMAVAIGDPIVYVLHKFIPKLVPVETPPFFSLIIIFWILIPQNSKKLND